MINTTEVKPLESRIDELVSDIQDLQCFYKHNEDILDIYEGNLLPYVEELMQVTLDKRYFDQIKHRVLPINFTQKVADKLAKSYADSPLRTADDQDFVDYYVKTLDLDFQMMSAEEYTYLNRGYALKPKLTDRGEIKMDVLPFDKFYVKADDKSDRLLPTVFVEFLGKTERQIVDERTRKTTVIEVDEYIAYTDTEIVAFDSSGAKVPQYTEHLNDINPIGAIPFVYGNRSRSNIIPKQDTDFLKLSKILPLMLSDVNGAIMFQCFTLIYGVDVEFQDASMNPNAIWNLKSSDKSDKPAQIGTLQPSVDSDKALTWFKNVLAMWLDTKGIDASSITKLDSQEMASGLSKAMDELDTTEARKKSIKYLQKEESQLFTLLAKLNNYWLKLPEAAELKLVQVDEKAIKESITIEFKEPMPKLDYTTEINNSVTMLQNGLSYREKEINRLHPYATTEEIDLMFFEYGEKRQEVGSKEVEDAVDPTNEEIQPPQDEKPDEVIKVEEDENIEE